MYPAVRVSPGKGVRKSVLEVQLHPGWTYVSKKRSFFSTTGETFSPGKSLPAGSRIVLKAYTLRDADPTGLSNTERELLRYIQIILPQGERPEQLMPTVKMWPVVSQVTLPPEVSLPNTGEGTDASFRDRERKPNNE